MNDKLTFTGGEPNMNEDDFLRIQNANREFIQNLFKDIPECIISGEVLAAPGAGVDLTLTLDAYVWLDGEILKVDAGTYTVAGANTEWQYVKATTYEAGGNKNYIDGTPRQTWQKNRAIPTSVVVVGATDLDCVAGQRWFKSDIVHSKVVNIGVWDMVANQNAAVTHGLDFSKIVGISVMISDDAGTSFTTFTQAVLSGTVGGMVGVLTAAAVSLSRVTGGFYDNTGFDDAVMNRGTVKFDYVD